MSPKRTKSRKPSSPRKSRKRSSSPRKKRGNHTRSPRRFRASHSKTPQAVAFKKEELAIYRTREGREEVVVVIGVHPDPDGGPTYYTIRKDDGTERQTDGTRLRRGRRRDDPRDDPDSPEYVDRVRSLPLFEIGDRVLYPAHNGKWVQGRVKDRDLPILRYTIVPMDNKTGKETIEEKIHQERFQERLQPYPALSHLERLQEMFGMDYFLYKNHVEEQLQKQSWSFGIPRDWSVLISFSSKVQAEETGLRTSDPERIFILVGNILENILSVTLFANNYPSILNLNPSEIEVFCNAFGSINYQPPSDIHWEDYNAKRFVKYQKAFTHFRDKIMDESTARERSNITNSILVSVVYANFSTVRKYRNNWEEFFKNWKEFFKNMLLFGTQNPDANTLEDREILQSLLTSIRKPSSWVPRLRTSRLAPGPPLDAASLSKKDIDSLKHLFKRYKQGDRVLYKTEAEVVNVHPQDNDWPPYYTIRTISDNKEVQTTGKTLSPLPNVTFARGAEHDK